MRSIRFFLCALVIGACTLSISAELPQGKWWLDKPVRLVQTNLREIDIIDFDVDRYVQDALDIGANTVLINVGGIVANYPSELPFHYVNPNLQFDVIGRVIERLHARGIRVIGRFDFSKLNETIAKNYPEYLYVSAVAGEHVNYNGQVHTCVNGEYQQQCLFKILDEATTRYDLDGIFFNMIGYQTRDYSHNYHGICQSQACKNRFKKWSDGLTLPTEEDMDDPVFRKYQQFKTETSDELFDKVGEFIKAKDKDICICTYTHAGVDLVRQESGSSFNGHPEWEFYSSDNVKTFLGSYVDKQIANAAVHFPTYGARHVSVSPYLTERRLVGNMMSGGSLDYYCIGRLDNQEDRAVLKNVKDVFQFHKKNEKYFTDINSNAEVLVITKRRWHGSGEYKGIFRILAENHVLFDVMDSWRLDEEDVPRQLEDYSVVFLPDVQMLSANSCERLDKFVENGGKLLATAFTSTRDEIGNPLDKFQLKSLGVEEQYSILEKAKGRYFRIRQRDKNAFATTSFDELDLVYLFSDLLQCTPTTADGFLGLIPQAMFGPPEKCYYTEVTEKPGLFHNEYAKGQAVYIPWGIGEHYNYHSHHGHAALVMAALNDVLEYNSPLKVDGSALVEVTRQVSQSGDFEWIGLTNHSGQLGTAVHKPLPILDTVIKIKPEKKVKAVKSLKINSSLKFEEKDGWVTLTVPKINSYDIIVLEY